MAFNLRCKNCGGAIRECRCHEKMGGSISSPCSPLLVRLYNAGYAAGHHDTAEGQFTDIHRDDADTYHEETVSEFIKENVKHSREQQNTK